MSEKVEKAKVKNTNDLVLEEVQESKNLKFALPKRKVLVKPILKEGRWLGKGHSGNFMYDNTKLILTVPISQSTGQLIDPLTPEEREYLENKQLSGMDFNVGDLSPYKKPDHRIGSIPFWYNFEYRIIKNQGIIDENTILAELDLSNPTDYINYKVLLANSGNGGIVAKSWDERFDQGTYKIVLVESTYAVETKASKADKLAEAYKYFGKMMSSQSKMYEFLSIYWLENKNALKPHKDAKIDFLKSEIQGVIDKDIDGFIKLMSEGYDEKLVIHQGMVSGALTRSGNTFMTFDGTPIGS